MWPFKRKASDLSDDLYLAVRNEQPKQAGERADYPLWVAKLIRLLIATWPSLLQLLLLIMENAAQKLSSEDKAEAVWGLNRYRRIVEASPKTVAKALEAV